MGGGYGNAKTRRWAKESPRTQRTVCDIERQNLQGMARQPLEAV